MRAMPPRFAIGAVLEFTTALASYPASAGWVLSHRLVLKEGAGAYIITSTASGDQHLTSVPAATTAAWAPGAYTWASWVTLGADVRDIATGEITLLPNPRTATGSLDLRSDAQQALDAVRAMLRGIASAGQRSYTIAGRSLERYSIAELIQLETKLARDVQREQQITTGRNPRRLVARVARA